LKKVPSFNLKQQMEEKVSTSSLFSPCTLRPPTDFPHPHPVILIMNYFFDEEARRRPEIKACYGIEERDVRIKKRKPFHHGAAFSQQ
jgi:hypothetical protein